MLYEPSWLYTIRVKPEPLSWKEAVMRAAPDTMELSDTWLLGKHFPRPDTRQKEIAVHFAWFGPYLTTSNLVAIASVKKYRPDLASASPYTLAWSSDQFPALVERFKETRHFVNGLGLVATAGTDKGVCMGVWLGINRKIPTIRMAQCDRLSTFQHSTLFAFVDREAEN